MFQALCAPALAIHFGLTKCPPTRPTLQVDPEQAALAALRREVKLLRTENTYLREQLFQASQPRGPLAAGAAGGASLVGSRLPSSHGQPPGTPGGSSTSGAPAVAPPLAGLSPFGTAGPASLGSRPASGTAGAAPATAGGISAPPGTAPSPEDMMRRLLETQRMLVQVWARVCCCTAVLLCLAGECKLASLGGAEGQRSAPNELLVVHCPRVWAAVQPGERPSGQRERAAAHRKDDGGQRL